MHLIKLGNTILTLAISLLFSNSIISQCTVTLGDDFEVCALNEITLNAIASGGTGPYIYDWSNSSTTAPTNTFTPDSEPFLNTTQTYTVTVTDQMGCVTSDEISVLVLSNPTVIQTPFNQTCLAISGIGFSLFDHPQRDFIQISFDGGANYTETVADNAPGTFYDLPMGTYHTFVRWDDMSCEVDLGEVTLINAVTSISMELGSDLTICEGESVTLNPDITEGFGEFSYSWVSTDGTESGTGLEITPIGSSTVHINKTYQVTVTDEAGCQAMDQISILIESRPTATFTTQDFGCNGNSGIDFSFFDHPNRISLQFSVDGGNNYLGFVPDNSSSIFYNLPPGDYHAYTSWDDGSCPKDLGPFSILNSVGSVTMDLGPNLTICDGETVVLDPTLTGGVGELTYDWISTDGTESGTGLSITPLGSSTVHINKTYVVTVTDEDGCQATDQISILIESRPTVTYVTTDLGCVGTSGIEFSYFDHPNRIALKFSVDGGMNFLGTVSDNSSSIFYELPPGDYHAFTSWEDDSCVTDLGEFSILEGSTSITLDLGSDIVICAGETAILNPTITDGSGTLTYTWVTTDGTESGTGLEITPAGAIGVDVAKDYDVTVTDSFGCQDTDRIRINARSLPIASISTTAGTCFTEPEVTFFYTDHASRATISLSIDGGASYLPGVPADSGSTSYTLPAGAYHAAVRWGDGTCEIDLGPFTLIDQGDSITMDVGEDEIICEGETVTLNPMITGGSGMLSYSWVSTDGTESGTGLEITPQGITDQDITKTYDVTVTDENDCFAVDQINIIIRSNPIASFVKSDACMGNPGVEFSFPDHTNRSSIQFSVDGGTTYFNGVNDASGSIFYDLTPGVYNAYVRWGDETCPIELGEFTIIDNSIGLDNGLDFSVCNGEEVTLNPTVINGTLPYNFTWTDGTNSDTGTTFTPAGNETSDTDRTYTITVTDGNGCIALDDVVITIRSNPTAEAISSTLDCSGNGEIRFDFPDHPQNTGIAFSLDGGVNYEPAVPDDSGSISYMRTEGTYDTYAKWSDDLCPIQLGEAELISATDFISAASGNLSDPIWSVSGSPNLFAITICNATNLTIGTGTTVTADSEFRVTDLIIQENATLDLSSNNYELILDGDFTSDGDFKAQQSKVIFAGGFIEQSINGTATSKFHDLEIQTFFNFNLNTALEVNGVLDVALGTLVTNGNKLTLVSELINDEVLTGSIAELDLPFSNLIGEIEIQRYVQSLNDGFRFIGVPIKNQTVGDFQGDFVTTGYTGSNFPSHEYVNVQYYDESGRVPGDPHSAYKEVTSTSDAILPNTGYIGYFPPSDTPNILNAEGEFNKGDITYNLSYTNIDSPAENGWNLIPNPYPSAIDIMSPDITFTNVDRAIYMIDHEIGDTWQGEYVVYNNGVSVNGATNIVASYQAFMVKANGSGASITFRETCKSNEQGVFYRNQTEERPLLRFSLGQNDHKFETVIAFHEDASEEFDQNYDAYRKESLQFSLGTICNADTLCINTQPDYNENQEFQVHVFTKEAGVYEFSLDDIQNIQTPLCIRVEDLLTGEQHALNQGDFFTFSSEADFNDVRFVITSETAADISVEIPSCYDSENGIIEVAPSLQDNYTFTLSSDMEFEDQTLTSTEAVVFDGLPSGFYNLEINSENGICADTQIPILIGNSIYLPEPSVSYIRDNCSEGIGKIFISANHNSELQVGIFRDGVLIEEVFGYELIEIDELIAGEYSVEVFDQCGSHEFSADLTPTISFADDFQAPDEVTLFNGSAVIEVVSDSENTVSNSWLVDGEWAMEGDRFYYEFNAPGVYDVTLVSRNGSCEQELSKSITVIDLTLGIEDVENSEFKLIVDENMIEINSVTDKKFDVIELYDIGGKLVEKIEVENLLSFSINHRNYPSGVYIIRLSSGGNTLFMDRLAK